MRAAYCALKGGVVQLMRTAALEYARTGIRVNVVCPGPIRTEMAEETVRLLNNGDPAIEAQFIGQIPMNRWGGADEVADAVVWLCSDAASFVTGHVMPVDGGWVAQ